MAKSFYRTFLKEAPWFLPKGARAGLAVFILMFAASLVWNGGFSVMGVTNGEAAKLVFTSFWPWVLFAQVKILLVYLALGYIVGLTAEIVAGTLFPAIHGMRFAWVIAANTYLLAANIRKYPQLYTESLYDRGGLFKFLQALVTDKLPGFLLDTAGIVLLSVFLLALGIYLAKKLSEKMHLAVLAAAAVVCASVLVVLPKYLPAKNTGPNIVVIAADSFRRDRLGGRKYYRKVTPNIDNIAAEGVVFNKAFTSFPRTFPAVISLLTGQLPVTHGVRHMFPDKYLRDHRSASVVEALRNKGYATAIVSDFAGDVFSRMKIGFEDVKAPYFNFITLIDQRSLEIHFLLMPYVTNPAGRKVFPELKEFANNGDPFLLADETIGELSKLTRKDRFFCFTFFSNVHFPYASPYPYYRKYTDPKYSGRFKYDKPPTLYSRENVGQEDIDQVHALYDGSVEAFDAAAGRIIDYLKARKCFDNTIIIITADHGENLYENNWYIGHGEHLRGDNVLNVPLVIRFPGKKYAGEINCVTRDIDVSPTLREYLGLVTPEKIDGVSLVPLLEGKKTDLGLMAFSETGIWFSDVSSGFFQQERIMYPDVTGISRVDFTCNMEVVLKKEYEALINTAKHRMVDDGKYRLIYVPERKGVKYQLFDRVKDYEYASDLSSKNAQKTGELKARLTEFMSRDKNIVFKNGFAVPQK